MGEYQSQPPREYKTTMDYKAENIRKAMDDKQEAIKISSAGRDAVLIVVNTIHPLRTKEMTDMEIQEKIIFWRDWLYKEVYTMSDNKYKELNIPF